MAENVKILWADDEIDLLRPQILFLEKKGYDIVTVSNGHDALDEMAEQKDIDIVFLDESMPGLSGLETLAQIKEKNRSIPIVMITKNEAESVMEEAIGSQIADYLIKPVNPNQILLTIKRLVDNKRLVKEKTETDYQIEFRQILMDLNNHMNFEEWYEIYKRIIRWELKIDASRSEEMSEILTMQKREANNQFSKFIERNYVDWITDEAEAPTMSHNLLRREVLLLLNKEEPVVLLVMDNLRYDQWKIIEPVIRTWYTLEEEHFFYSILPTATQYSRNAIFAGLLPVEIEKRFPDKWRNDNDEGGKNQFEKDFLADQIDRLVRRDIKMDYHKITNVGQAKVLEDQCSNFIHNDLTVIVYNFIDMLSHARTEMEVLKELAGDEKAYRALTKNWLEHSPLLNVLRQLAEKNIQLVITTDHGTIRVKQPSKVIGDRETTTNLRYKSGKNLRFKSGDVLEISDPKKAGLPMSNVSTRYVFAKDDYYFLYPNNYNYYNSYYRDTFQHGGISLEEIICPVVKLRSKGF